MNATLVLGSLIVVAALLAYSLGVWCEQWKRQITREVLICLFVGVVLDVTATICMIVGSRNSGMTLHGVIGYSALLAMLLEAYFIGRSWLVHRGSHKPTQFLHIYTRVAYSWWLLAFLAGGLLVAFGSKH